MQRKKKITGNKFKWSTTIRVNKGNFKKITLDIKIARDVKVG